MTRSPFAIKGEAAVDIIPKLPRLKATLIGAGSVGMTCAYSMVIQNSVDQLTIVDINREKLAGEVMDLIHGLPFVEPTAIRGGEMSDSDDPDIVILTAGSKQKPGESRLDLLHRNVKIFKSLVPEAVKYAPNAIFLVVSNPVDIMTYVTLKLSGLPSHRVFGSGTVLDTARFRALLAEKYRLDPRSIHAYIIGEHGDSEVPVWSKVNISGMQLFGSDGKGGVEDIAPIFDKVKNAAYEIIQRKGATFYAIGLGVNHIVNAVLRDQNRVMTVSSLMEGIYDVEEVCLSLPTVVSRRGVDRLVDIELSETERQQFQHSAKILKETISQLDL